MNNQLNQNRLTYFSRWTRSGWAVFASLNKVIKISVITTGIISSLGLQKSEAQTVEKQKTDSIRNLEQVEVLGELPLEVYNEMSRLVTVIKPSQQEQSPAITINDLLTNLSQLDMRQRGPISVQADVGMRGGHFDQVLILVNGISINNLQTGHHNLDLPFGLDDVESVEVLSGPASRIYGTDAYSGAINFVTKKNQPASTTISTLLGQFGLHSVGLSTSLNHKYHNHFISVSSDGSAGYTENTDFQNIKLYYNSNLKIKKSNIDFQILGGIKSFGANSFYTPKYPDQFEETQKAMMSIKYSKKGKININANIYGKGHSDKFELFRIEELQPVWYKNHNYHLTSTIGTNNSIWFNSKYGKTQIGTNFRQTQIWSNVLGINTDDTIKSFIYKEGFYNKYDIRNEFAVFTEQTYYYKNWRFSGGIMYNYFSNLNNSNHFFPGLEASCQLGKSITIYTSLNTGLRQPTFTDLYYQGPTNIGNINLKPETNKSIEIGLKRNQNNLNLYITTYYNLGENTIDWVRISDTVKWQPMNISATKGIGIETGLKYQFSKIPTVNRIINILSINYSFHHSQRTSGVYQSNYFDDYLKHKINIEMEHTIWKQIKLGWNYSYQKRNGSFNLFDKNTLTEQETPYPTIHLVNVKLIIHHQNINYYLQATNLLNHFYYDLSNIESPGRWISIGLKAKINRK